jgi:hypothetical protein
MHQTLTSVWHEVRLRIAPIAQGFGPFLRPTKIEDLLACFDHGAIDRPDDDRRHLSSRDRNHGLVEQSDALGRLAQPDQRLTAAQPCQGHEIRFAEPVGDLVGPLECGACGSGIA